MHRTKKIVLVSRRLVHVSDFRVQSYYFLPIPAIPKNEEKCIILLGVALVLGKIPIGVQLLLGYWEEGFMRLPLLPRHL